MAAGERRGTAPADRRVRLNSWPQPKPHTERTFGEFSRDWESRSTEARRTPRPG